MEPKSSPPRILHLSLNAKAFEVMLKGERKVETRRPSKWLLSRLAPAKNYDLIKFVNGYGNDKPFFIAEYLGWETSKGKSETNSEIIKIHFGKIIEQGNIRLPGLSLW